MKSCKTLLLMLLLLTGAGGLCAQFNGTWYTFRIDELLFTTISSDQVVTGRIGRYGTDGQYTASVDTIRILKRLQRGDSVLYLITAASDFAPLGEKPDLRKYRFDPATSSLQTFYYGLMSKALELHVRQDGTDLRPYERLVQRDTFTTAYLRYYGKDSLQKFLSYPKLIDQPRETIVAVYTEISRRIETVRALPEAEQLPYALMRGLSRSALEAPVYLKYRTCPMIQPENFEALAIAERYPDDEAIQKAVRWYLHLRN